jgi:hypothetical protein
MARRHHRRQLIRQLIFMKKTVKETRSLIKLGGTLLATVRLVTCHTPNLGDWDIFEWSVFDKSQCIETGSFAAGNDFVCVDDVTSQLVYNFITCHQLETVPQNEGHSDADPGL